VDDEVLGTWRALLTAHARVHRRINAELAAADLPDLSWYDLLWAIYRQPGKRLRVNQIADEVALSPTATSRFVDRVEAAGCVRREADPEDRRALQVAITDEGVTLLRRMWPVYERGIERYVGEQLGRSARTVRTALQRMAEAARE
jgi:DNA-binding MarR family transcriptional regulator